MTRTSKRPPTGQITDDNQPTRTSEPNCPIVNRLNYWPAQGPNISSPNTTDPARRTPKLVATLPAKSGRQPSDSESAAQLHPGPQPPSGRAKVATRYYQVTTTQLGTRPNLPLLYGPSSGGLPADSESTGQLHPGPAPAIGPGQGDDTVLPNDNDSARHSPRLAAPQRTKFGTPACRLGVQRPAVPARADCHHEQRHEG